jgi:hypothetical protein
MIDLNDLEKLCPKCSGLGRAEDPGYPIWAQSDNLKNSFQVLETKESLTVVKEIDTDQLNDICKECHGKGKILTDQGKLLIEFVRFWLNPNF